MTTAVDFFGRSTSWHQAEHQVSPPPRPPPSGSALRPVEEFTVLELNRPNEAFWGNSGRLIRTPSPLCWGILSTSAREETPGLTPNRCRGDYTSHLLPAVPPHPPGGAGGRWVPPLNPAKQRSHSLALRRWGSNAGCRGEKKSGDGQEVDGEDSWERVWILSGVKGDWNDF